jgi:hypothetical protein
MSSNELRRTPTSVAERKCDTGSDAGDDRHQRADLVIKAAGIYSMAETREADAPQAGILPSRTTGREGFGLFDGVRPSRHGRFVGEHDSGQFDA